MGSTVIRRQADAEGGRFFRRSRVRLLLRCNVCTASVNGSAGMYPSCCPAPWHELVLASQTRAASR